MALDLNDLNGPQRRIVRDAFLGAFTAASLDMMLQDELNMAPLATLAAPASFQFMVFELVNVSRRNGWTDRLIEAAERTSANPRIQKLRRSLETSETIDLVAVDTKIKIVAPASGGLERLVRDDGIFVDWGMWLDRMTDMGRQICRVEYPRNLKMGGGTGFLVAPDLVLTNYHVVEDHVKGSLKPSEIVCRFDYAVGTGTSTPVKLAAHWLVDHSTYSPHDPGDRDGVPDMDHLDYALLRLDRAIGDDVISNEKRGWIPLSASAAAPAGHSILFVGQHPELAPLKLAVGAIIGANANTTRIRYDTSTDNGSSGAPCFDVSLNTVVLRHGGDPDYSKL